jgi:hypothetical protein
MFVLLQIYPLEATAEDGSDDNCCLDVIAVGASKATLERFLASYERRYRAAVAAFDAWDNTSSDWGEEHEHKIRELQGEHNLHGALVSGTRFKILESQIFGQLDPARAVMT